MTILQTASESEVSGLAAELYAEDLESHGYVPSHTRAMALNPEAVRAFEALVRSVAPGLGMRRYELVTLAAAGAIGSKACRFAHGVKSLSYIDADELERVARDFRNAGLPADEVAMMEFAERLSRDSAAMTEQDAAVLRQHGFSDRDIVDIALAAAARNFYSRALHALGVEVDVPPSISPELKEALLAGMRESRHL
jgi:uncharacterized peroxidase-related enzyme